MKKLLIFHPIVGPYRIDFFNSLAQNFNVWFCMFYRNMIDQKFEYENISRLFQYKPIILDKYYKIPFIRIRKNILSTIKTYNPDIVLVSECGYVSIIAVLYKIIFRKKYKIVSMIDDSIDMLSNGHQFSKKHEYAEKILLPFFDDVITVDPKVTAYFQRKYKKGIFFPIVQDERRIRTMYGKALNISNEYIDKYNIEKKKIILFVGRLAKEKNIDLAIKAFIKGNFKDTCLIIVGSGKEESHLKELASNNDNIIFTGRLEGLALYAWYNIAELFILPSSLEPFGAVTNEALIGGCFCLISNKAGSSCLIKSGINGYTFDSDNIDQLSRLIYKSLEEVKLRNYPLQIRNNRMQLTYKHCINEVIQKML